MYKYILMMEIGLNLVPNTSNATLSVVVGSSCYISLYIHTEHFMLVKSFCFIKNFGFKNSVQALALRVLSGIGRSWTLRGRVVF